VSAGRCSPFTYWRHFNKNRRRREHTQLKQLLNKGSAAEPLLPSTFGLEPDELRRHANDLVVRHGWTVAEVTAVLDIEPAATP
jgi:hypothetical protein